MKIGIPRALSFFDYFPLWQTFFNSLGLETLVSPDSNKDILNKGVSLCVDDACLPVKLFHGHVSYLIGRVDAIFIPRLVSVSPKEFICPKFIGLPEMIKNSVKGLPRILVLNHNIYKGEKDLFKGFRDLGLDLEMGKKETAMAYKEALKRQNTFFSILEAGQNPFGILYPGEQWGNIHKPRGTIGVIGHPYLLYDRYLSMDIIRKLRGFGYNVKVPENVSMEGIERSLRNMPKRLFWTYGKKILGSGIKWLDDLSVDGLVFLSSFGCGIDSFMEDLLRRYNNRGRKIPYLLFTLDEHSGEAGFETRLEAFLDMMEWRRNNGSNISPYGHDVRPSQGSIRRAWGGYSDSTQD